MQMLCLWLMFLVSEKSCAFNQRQMPRWEQLGWAGPAYSQAQAAGQAEGRRATLRLRFPLGEETVGLGWALRGCGPPGSSGMAQGGRRRKEEALQHPIFNIITIDNLCLATVPYSLQGVGLVFLSLLMRKQKLTVFRGSFKVIYIVRTSEFLRFFFKREL